MPTWNKYAKKAWRPMQKNYRKKLVARSADRFRYKGYRGGNRKAYRTPTANRGWRNTPGELKYKDHDEASYALNTTGSVVHLNGVAVGDDNNTRDGRQIYNKSIHVMGQIATANPAIDNTIEVFARLMIVWDSQPNSGAIATIANILTSATSMAHLNLDNRERFTILKDCKYVLGLRDGDMASAPNTYLVDEFIDLKNVKTTYSGTTDAIGSIATGALLLVAIGDEAASNYRARVSARLRFSDN